jgi:hypothetical protein
VLAKKRQTGLIDFTDGPVLTVVKWKKRLDRAGNKQLIEEKFVLVSLYVDDRAKIERSGSVSLYYCRRFKISIARLVINMQRYSQKILNASQPLYRNYRR